MSQHDFTELEKAYPSVIDAMPNPFTSHQFILVLAQQNQRLYIDALSTYRHTLKSKDSPFQVVHKQLADRLHQFADSCGTEKKSKDIFGVTRGCEKWRKRP